MARITEHDTEREITALKKTLSELRHQIANLTRAEVHSEINRFQDVTSHLRDLAQENIDKMRDKINQAREYGHDTAEQARDKIRTRPLKTVAMVFAIGALAGYLFHRRRG